MPGWNIVAAGPVFDGQAEAGLLAIATEIRTAVADLAETEVHTKLGTVLQHPTGRYEGQIVKDVASPDAAEISDSGIIYGPWLEGVGRRNESTRFKGYRTFRKVTQDLNRGRAGALATMILARNMGRLG